MNKTKAVDLSSVRLTNYRAIWENIRINKSATIPQISKAIDLSLPTVTRGVDYGVETGILLKAEIVGAERGRKAQSYSINADYTHALLMEISPERIYVMVHNFLGESVKEEELLIDDTNALTSIDKLINKCVNTDPDISIIAIAFSGIVHNDTIISSWSYPSLDGINLVERIREKTGKMVVISNDVQVSALAAHHYEIDAEKGITAVFVFGEGRHGAGILVDGRLLKSATGAIGDIGSIPSKYEDRNSFEFHVDQLLALISIVNPDKVILHEYGNKQMCPSLIDEVTPKIRNCTVPEFIVGENIISDCFMGLSLLCREKIQSVIESKMV